MTSMRDLFPEWYRPDSGEVADFYDRAVVVPDANVLLSVYRVGEAAAQIFEVFEKYGDRLWVTHQAALEYHRNRLQVIESQVSHFDNFQKEWDAMAAKVKTIAKQGGSELLEAMSDRLKKAETTMFDKIEGLKSKNTLDSSDPVRFDPHRDRWEQILDGKIGSPPGENELASRRKTAKDRASRQMPPGYRDYELKKPDELAAGDYLTWHELLEYARTHQKPILFITDDVKEDWYDRPSGKTHGPRVELVREMRNHADVRYWQVKLDQFLKHSSGSASEDVRKRLQDSNSLRITGVQWGEFSHPEVSAVASGSRPIRFVNRRRAQFLRLLAEEPNISPELISQIMRLDQMVMVYRTAVNSSDLAVSDSARTTLEDEMTRTVGAIELRMRDEGVDLPGRKR